MIKKLSFHLSKHPLQRHFLFLGLAVLTVALNGYHFGTFDQVFHITFLKEFLDPSLYPGDPFLDLRWYHFSFFWFPFIPLMKAGLLEISMFVIHILTVYGTIWMFWALANLLFNNPLTNLLVTLALIFPHIGFPGFQIIEFSLLNRTSVLPFLLGSIYLYLRGKKLLAFGLLGLMFNLHVIYAAFVLSMFLLNELLTFKWKAWWIPLSGLLVFIFFGLPVLIWRTQTGNGIDLTLRPEMLDLATRGLLFTVYYPFALIPHVIGNLVAGIGTVAAFILGYRQAPTTPRHQSIRNFTYAIAVLIGIGLISAYLLPMTILIQLQLLRAGVFMLYFGMLYLAHFLVKQYEKGQLSNTGFILLGLSFILLISPLAAILIWVLLRSIKQTRFNPAWLIPVVVLFEGLTLFISLRTNLMSPGFHIYGPKSDWRDVQEWAKTNTPVETKFITPPHLFWHYTPDWRVFSERASVATAPEMMEIPFDPNYANGFRTRFEAVAPGAIDRFDGNYMKTLEITKEAYYTNSMDDFINAGCQFGAEYLVVEADHPYPLLPVYENEGFLVYPLPACEP
jgi:hypothetical protein